MLVRYEKIFWKTLVKQQETQIFTLILKQLKNFHKCLHKKGFQQKVKEMCSFPMFYILLGYNFFGG